MKKKTTLTERTDYFFWNFVSPLKCWQRLIDVAVERIADNELSSLFVGEESVTVPFLFHNDWHAYKTVALYLPSVVGVTREFVPIFWVVRFERNYVYIIIIFAGEFRVGNRILLNAERNIFITRPFVYIIGSFSDFA